MAPEDPHAIVTEIDCPSCDSRVGRLTLTDHGGALVMEPKESSDV